MHPRNQALTSLVYLGKYLFFFGKKYTGKDSDINYKFILNEINLLNETHADNENFVISSNVHDENVSVHFAQEGESKGKQLVFTQDELNMPEVQIDHFLLDQYIQIVDNFELDEIKIYSMKKLDTCLTSRLKFDHFSRTEFVNNKFIQLFVIRECQNSKTEIEKLFEK